MASREKRALAPSKSKQKANNDSSSTLSSAASSASSSSDSNRNASNKKNAAGKQPLTNNTRSQQAREIFDSVATGAQLPVKLEVGLPRKRALQTALKRKQKAKNTLIKVKQKVPIKTLKRIAGAKKTIFKKKFQSVESADTKNKCKTAKKKSSAKASEQVESEGQDKTTLKLGKKVLETSPKTAKGGKASIAQKRNDSKERDIKVKRSLSKEPEEVKVKIEPNDNSYELTIEEVIATSMLVEPKTEVEGEESASEGELKGKKSLRNPLVKRSLRNGKLRQPLIKPDPDAVSKKPSSMSELTTETLFDLKTSETSSDAIVSVKVEQNSEDLESTAVVPAGDQLTDSQPVETNNNGCESEDMGPTLRSKTKARGSDEMKPTAEVNAKTDESKAGAKSEIDLAKKESTVSKAAEIKAPSEGTAPKSRRSSITPDSKRPAPNVTDVDREAEEKSARIDDMIKEIKKSIAKTIETRAHCPETRNTVLSKNYDIPKLQEMLAKENEERAKAEAAKAEAAKSQELTTEIGSDPGKNDKVEDADANSVPKVANTAKEIEKLVMGDIEPAGEACELANDKSDKSTDEANSVKQLEQKVATNASSNKEEEPLKDDLQSMEIVDDSADKESNNKLPEDVKKPVTTSSTRKSTRVSTCKTSTPETKNTLNRAEISNEIKKQSEEEKTTKESPEITAGNKTSESGIIINNDENKTASSVDVSMNISQDDELISLSVSTDDKNEIIEKAASVNEETLESLSTEVEKLLEDDSNAKSPNKTEELIEKDASYDDVEIRLVIEDEVSEIDLKEVEAIAPDPETKMTNDNCDQKSSSESTSAVEAVEESTLELKSSVQNNPETENPTNTSKSPATEDKSNIATKIKSEIEEVEEQKENRRVLRTRTDKQKKIDSKSTSAIAATVQDKIDTKTAKKPGDAATSEVPLDNTQASSAHSSKKENEEKSVSDLSTESVADVAVKSEITPRITYRKRKTKEYPRRPPSMRAKRASKIKKVDQSKEELLLDSEVAKINESVKCTRFVKSKEGVRGVSAQAGNVEQQHNNDIEGNNRSKSENDVQSAKVTNNTLKSENSELPEMGPVKGIKDLDQGSNSGESSSSAEKYMETPEEIARKEDILRHLGLETWEKANERRARMEQALREEPVQPVQRPSTGTLKTVIRVGKDSKKRSRSPLKIILKPQGRTDVEEPTNDNSTPKEPGSDDAENSNSGANRKLPINARLSCDEEVSLVIPEKSASFSIHPGRLCSDNCGLCQSKFGSLDTPGHVAQVKCLEKRQKILDGERQVTQEMCLCDACFRHVTRRWLSPTSLGTKPQSRRQTRHSVILVCPVRSCLEPGRHHVKRQWLRKLRAQLKNLIDIDWDTPQIGGAFNFCSVHFPIIETFLICIVCIRRLTKNNTVPLGLNKDQVEELNRRFHDLHIPQTVVINTFICRLCKYLAKILLKNPDFESMTASNRCFVKKYRKKLLQRHNVTVYDSDDEEEEEEEEKEKEAEEVEHDLEAEIESKSVEESVSKPALELEAEQKPGPSRDQPGPTNKGKGKALANGSRRGKGKSSRSEGYGESDNIEEPFTSTSEKSTPEPLKTNSNVEQNEVAVKSVDVGPSTSSATEARCSGLESAIEKLKKRKALHLDTTLKSDLSINSLQNLTDMSASTSNGSTRDLVEMIANEVTVTRVSKRPKISNTSTPNSDIPSEVQRLGANPSISVRSLFPGEEDMNLQATVEFNNVREITPQGWEKCSTMIQYDRETKLLWQELQRPYGNQSSFMRHLILLEKYYRAGDLILAPNASRNAINYSTSVQNRLISYEGPEKVDEPIVDIVESVKAVEYNNSRRLSGGYVVEQRDRRLNQSSTSSSSSIVNVASQLSKLNSSSQVMKLTPGVSIIKKPPPSLQRLNTNRDVNGSLKKRNESAVNESAGTGKVFHLTEPDFKRLQTLKRQKLMMNEKQPASSIKNASGNPSKKGSSYAPYQQYPQSQFQKHLLRQQEMLNQRSRSDFEPLTTCALWVTKDTSSENLINNLNLPKSIQVTTKPPVATSTPISLAGSSDTFRIPKNLTVIPQTVVRTQDN